MAVHHEGLPEPLVAVAAHPLALADTVAALRRYSLVRVVADGLFTHRLLQTVVRAALDAETERVYIAAALRLVVAGFPDHSNEVVNWPECERLLPHVFAVVDHAQRLEVEPKACLLLLNRAGHYLWSRGQYGQSVLLTEQTLAGYRRVLGEDHPYTFTSMNNLATTRGDLGDLQGARQLLEQTLAGRRRLLGEDHPDTLASMNYLANVRRELGEL